MVAQEVFSVIYFLENNRFALNFPPHAPTANSVGSCPTVSLISRTPGTALSHQLPPTLFKGHLNITQSIIKGYHNITQRQQHKNKQNDGITVLEYTVMCLSIGTP